MVSSSTMASVSPSMSVEEEVKCPICMEYLKVPVSVDCSHNFCRSCITHYCETWEDLGEDPGNLECPLCKAKMKKRNFRPNWQLANIVEKIKHLSLSLVNEHLCVKHKEKLHLFCKDDQELVCLFCERSPEHQSHTVLLLEEAAKECREHLSSCLEVLKKEREKIMASKAGIAKESEDLLFQIVSKKARTMAVFSQLYLFLEEQKTILFLHLEELEKETKITREEQMARLAKELSSLESLIQQMEEKCQQPASELLQDIRRTLKRYEKTEEFKNPVAFPPELTFRIEEFCDVTPFPEGVMKEWKLVTKEANVTLDPDTANPHLILSKDCKSVRRRPVPQILPSNPKRFDGCPCVLGQEEFTAGRHFWEVTVGNERDWAVGVARKSIRRKGLYDLTPEEGIWAVGKCRFYSFNAPPLSLSLGFKMIRVTLDCDKGRVAFYDAKTGIPIYTYSGASFCSEPLLPFFYVDGEAHLRLCP